MKHESIWRMFIVAALLVSAFTSILAISKLNEVDQNQDLGRRQRQTFQAEQRFILCAREGITDPVKLRELNVVCEGYDNLEESYRTERNR